MWRPLRKGANAVCVHLIQLQRKPEPKEVDNVTFGKKAKDISCRAKTAKEEWKDREASANQTAPTRIKIFEGGSVKTGGIRTLVTCARWKCHCFCCRYFKILSAVLFFTPI